MNNVESPVKKSAKKLVEKYATNDPFELASYLNIEICFMPLGTIKGFYKYVKRTKFIFINDNLNDYFKRIVCAHELGHAVIHPRVNIMFLKHNTYFVKDKFESQANRFAAELLISDDLHQRYPEYYNLEQIAVSENLPIQLLKLKFDI